MRLNAEFDQSVVVDAGSLDWVASPMKGVDRRMLDRIGAEVARATSLVRYAPESYFSPHTHGGGEEFLVLDGTFVDEHGDYPSGMYVRNPVGSAHTPSSPKGCVIFVKLWQMAPEDQTFVRTRLEDVSWLPVSDGMETAPLHAYEEEVVDLIRLTPGTLVPLGDDGGMELLILQGDAIFDGQALARHGWGRFPPGGMVEVCAPEGALLWRKRGHLRSVNAPTA